MIVRRARRVLSPELETDLDFPTVEPDDADELFKDLDASRRGRSPSISRLIAQFFRRVSSIRSKNETGLEVVEIRDHLPIEVSEFARYIYNYFVECNFVRDPLPPTIQLSVRWKLDFERQTRFRRGLLIKPESENFKVWKKERKEERDSSFPRDPKNDDRFRFSFFQFTNREADRLIGAHASFEVTFHRICEKEEEGGGSFPNVARIKPL